MRQSDSFRLQLRWAGLLGEAFGAGHLRVVDGEPLAEPGAGHRREALLMPAGEAGEADAVSHAQPRLALKQQFRAGRRALSLKSLRTPRPQQPSQRPEAWRMGAAFAQMRSVQVVERLAAL